MYVCRYACMYVCIYTHKYACIYVREGLLYTRRQTCQVAPKSPPRCVALWFFLAPCFVTGTWTKGISVWRQSAEHECSKTANKLTKWLARRHQLGVASEILDFMFRGCFGQGALALFILWRATYTGAQLAAGTATKPALRNQGLA